MLARLAIKILRPALVSTVLSTTLPCACGGRSRHQMPSGTGGSGGFSAAADRGGTGSSSGGSVACLPANRRGCVTGSDCCSEICRFNIGSTWDEDAGAFLPEEIGTCGSCKPSGAACGGDQSSGCCSGSVITRVVAVVPGWTVPAMTTTTAVAVFVTASEVRASNQSAIPGLFQTRSPRPAGGTCTERNLPA